MENSFNVRKGGITDMVAWHQNIELQSRNF